MLKLQKWHRETTRGSVAAGTSSWPLCRAMLCSMRFREDLWDQDMVKINEFMIIEWLSSLEEGCQNNIMICSFCHGMLLLWLPTESQFAAKRRSVVISFWRWQEFPAAKMFCLTIHHLVFAGRLFFVRDIPSFFMGFDAHFFDGVVSVKHCAGLVESCKYTNSSFPRGAL